MRSINRSPYKNNKKINQFLGKLLAINNDNFIIDYRNDILSPVDFYDGEEEGEDAISNLETYVHQNPGSDMSLELYIVGPENWVNEKHTFLGTQGFNIQIRRSIVEEPIQCFMNDVHNIITN